MGMKCVRCGTDNNLRDRTNNQGRCKNCNHPFVFEPSAVTDYRLMFTDPFFAKAINDISDQNRLYFTPKQLFYLLVQKPIHLEQLDVVVWLFLFFYLDGLHLENITSQY